MKQAYLSCVLCGCAFLASLTAIDVSAAPPKSEQMEEESAAAKTSKYTQKVKKPISKTLPADRSLSATTRRGNNHDSQRVDRADARDGSSLDSCGSAAPNVTIKLPHIVVGGNDFHIKIELSCKPETETLVQLITHDQELLPVPQPNGNTTIAAGEKEHMVSDLTAGNPSSGKYVKLRAVLLSYPGKHAQKNVWVESSG